ncbi:DUF411 domain-containing protein [Massilia yuzhufengensis]|uniref:Uncharacterized conserved protein n=1 Tax=Massilia yuzhufengensis TaxID=1164594 RepID=A0A1I1QYL9_9BURK|nr:DUF411 domain-containing protein [Massilia yuzhufengensis]SFD27067.1 Uncharacterized conserved protein [Massilia yuzhufengensis]
MQLRFPRHVALAAALAFPLLASAAQPVIEVFKTATCGCCKEWIKHLEANGFTVKSQDVASTSDYRAKFGIAQQYGSCHTGRVGGYAIEGHVPASDIKRLLAAKPKARGLAVPGMPMGSPGMEGPRKDPYEVLLVKDGGKTAVFKRYE